MPRRLFLTALLSTLAPVGKASGTSCPVPVDERLSLQLDSVTIDGARSADPTEWAPPTLSVTYPDYRQAELAVTAARGEGWRYCRAP